MKKTLILFLSFYCLLLLFLPQKVIAQGCSDAGFCSSKSLKAPTAFNNLNSTQFTIGVSYGLADHGISVVSQNIALSIALIKSLSVDVKLSSNLKAGTDSRGSAISNFGAADIYVNTAYQINNKLALSIGLKIPLTNGNESFTDAKNNIAFLPLDFQNSLGTFDLIFGINYKLPKFFFAFGGQIPIQQSFNEFSNSGNENFSSFMRTNGFHRAPDLLLRVNYTSFSSDLLSASFGPLFIFHTANDTVFNSPVATSLNPLNGREMIANSSGLTINLTGALNIKLKNKKSLNVSLGFPIVTRSIRPDGLTRAFVLGASLNF